MPLTPEELDPRAILAGIGVAPPDDAVRVEGGMDTALWRVTHGRLVSALRVFRPEQALVCRREIAAMAAARAAGVPVPTIRAHGVWRDRPALLIAWAPGVPLAQALRAAPWRTVRLGRALGRTQALIHRAAPPAAWLDRPQDWIGWAGADEELGSALATLAAPRPALLHLDYHMLNVLTDGTRITAVLDWANARAGDPRADVARTATMLLVEPYMSGRQPIAITLVRWLLAWGWRRGYAEAGGLADDMDWFYAWAAAVMVRDLGRRVDDPASWWEPRHIAAIEAWGQSWRGRARSRRH